MKKLLPLLILLFYSAFTFAQGTATVKGLVVDKQNGEPMLGAAVTLKNKSGYTRSTGTGLDGTFVFRNVPEGDYEVEVKYVSYQKAETTFTLRASEVRPVKIQIEAKINNLQDVSVTA